VILPLVVRVTATRHGTSRTVIVTCRLAQRSDLVELQVLPGAQWQDLLSRRLDHAGQATFALTARKASVSYRIVLLNTAAHGESVSTVIMVPPHRGTAAGGPATNGGIKKPS
jgi:hypothetical protein